MSHARVVPPAVPQLAVPIPATTHDVANEAVLRNAMPDEPSRKRLILTPNVARHFTPQEKESARAWHRKHEGAIPKAENYDPYLARVDRELRRFCEYRIVGKPDPSDDDLIESAPYGVSLAGEIASRIEATADRTRPSRSIERFMPDADEYLEPYLALRGGMSQDVAAKTFNLADIPHHLNTVEVWLDQIAAERRSKVFDRDAFLAKLKRAIETRRQDAWLGRAREDARHAAELRQKDEENVPKRGAEWATVNNIWIPNRDTRPHLRKRDKRFLTAASVTSYRGECNCVGCRIERNGGTMHGRKMVEANTRALGAEAMRVPNPRVMPTNKRMRAKLLENGLIAILESRPPSPHRRELVDIVDLVQAGKTRAEIARTLNLPFRTVKRRLEDVQNAARSICPQSEQVGADS